MSRFLDKERITTDTPTFDGLASTLADWDGIPVGNVAGVDNFADGRYDETECDTPDDIVFRITIKDGDGDNTDGVNNIGDDSGRCDDSDDWPVVDDDDDETVGVGGA